MFITPDFHPAFLASSERISFSSAIAIFLCCFSGRCPGRRRLSLCCLSAACTLTSHLSFSLLFLPMNLVYKKWGKKASSLTRTNVLFFCGQPLFFHHGMQLTDRLADSAHFIDQTFVYCLLSNQDCSQISGQHLCIQHQAL